MKKAKKVIPRIKRSRKFPSKIYVGPLHPSDASLEGHTSIEAFGNGAEIGIYQLADIKKIAIETKLV